MNREHTLFAVYDKKVESHGPVFQAMTPAQAVRDIQDEANRNDSKLNKHPEDYALYIIGTYDQDTGVIKPVQPPRLLVNVTELLQQQH